LRNVEVVKELIKAGNSVDHINKNGENALIVAS
jgi:hypothetical protein